MSRSFGVTFLASTLVCVTGLWLPIRAQEWRALFISSFDLTWQTVAETFHDPTFGGIDWAAVRLELRPRVVAAGTPDEARAVLRDMLKRLGQSHFEVLSADTESESLGGEAIAPFDVRIVDGQAVVTSVLSVSPADAAGLQVGDRLLAVDGWEIQPGLATQDGESARVRDARFWRRVMRALSGPEGDSVMVRWIRPDGGQRSGRVTFAVEAGDPVVFGNLPRLRTHVRVEEVRSGAGRRVGVVRFNLWMPAIGEPVAQAVDRFRDADGIVIDLRGNPGGVVDMMRGIAGHFLSEPALLGRMHMRGVDLEFRANPRRSTSDGRRVEPFAGPVAILVDGLTASTSECFAAGLQGLGRARVFGTQTMGQALPASTRTLPNRDVLLYAVGDFVTGEGLRLEGRGVTPDELVPLVPTELAAGRDAQARAVSWIDRLGSIR